ncbi:MAG: DUF2612 domain-containing protein [Alphaproteobacteria bacterium]|nr:DUF2612 domain-containing protein [Alphaproteobacteria bacterium]
MTADGSDAFYPYTPVDNGIGYFAIGISPIGNFPDFQWPQTVISQYANSPILLKLIEDFDENVSQPVNMQAFYDLVWNVDTAQGWGLDVWGRIVGVSRVLQIPSGSFMGMEGPAGASGDPFNVSPFYAGSGASENFSLTDQAFRTLILAKALANISDGSISALNQLLVSLFPGRGNCYVTDGNDMTMTYTFEFPLSEVEYAIISQSGALPKPSGVSVIVVSP